MAIASMTGFAREAGITGSTQWAWELKSVNGRGLEVRLRVPPGFDAVAEEARLAVQKALSRGQCQLNLTLVRAAGPSRVRVNQEVLSAVLDALAKAGMPPDIKPPTADGLLAVRGVIEVEDDAADEAAAAALAADLRSAAMRAVEALSEARRSEGRALAEVARRQIKAIEDLVDAAEASPARGVEAVRERLKAQVEALLGASNLLDPTRLHQEAALLATRADIREELDRLRAHVEAARALLDQGGAVGRRLDFLAQEFGREANTLCAKANDVALSRIGLDLKAVVEQFREQVQNVE